MEGSEKNHKDITRRLDVVIGLLLDLLSKGGKKVEGDQMFRLRQLGLTNPEIGAMFGKNADQVKKQVYWVGKKK